MANPSDYGLGSIWVVRFEPSAEAVFAIRKALQALNPNVAKEFVWLYLENGEENS